MRTIDWSYMRAGCETCRRARAFLERSRVAAKTEVDARKERLGRREAFALLRDVDLIVATKGRSVVRLDLRRDAPGEDEIAKLLIGPSGNLRAPAQRVGRTLLIGFDPDAYARVLR